MKTKLRRNFVQVPADQRADSVTVEFLNAISSPPLTKIAQLPRRKVIKKVKNSSMMKWIIEDTSLDIANLSSTGNPQGRRISLQQKPQLTTTNSKDEIVQNFHVENFQGPDSEELLLQGPIKERMAHKRQKIMPFVSSPDVAASQNHLISPESVKREEIDPLQPKRMKASSQFSDFILRTNLPTANPYTVLVGSALRSGRRLDCQTTSTESGEKMITITLDGIKLGSAIGPDVKHSKLMCSKQILKKLQESCYTLQVKNEYANPVAVEYGNATSSKPALDPAHVPSYLAEDSKANKMMKAMGWAGGGLGKNEKGRREPVEAVQQVGRAGFGCVSVAQLKNHIRGILETCGGQSLMFSPPHYSKKDWPIIKRIVAEFGRQFHFKTLKKDEKLFVSKSPWTTSGILNDPQTTNKYIVIPPGTLNKSPSSPASAHETPEPKNLEQKVCQELAEVEQVSKIVPAIAQGPGFKNHIMDILKVYDDSGDSHNVVFSSDFSLGQRAQIHRLAASFGTLRSQSYGSGDDRHIVVNKRSDLPKVQLYI